MAAQNKNISAGYSRTPLAKKLGIKEGSVVFAAKAPANYQTLLVTNSLH